MNFLATVIWFLPTRRARLYWARKLGTPITLPDGMTAWHVGQYTAFFEYPAHNAEE